MGFSCVFRGGFLVGFCMGCFVVCLWGVFCLSVQAYVCVIVFIFSMYVVFVRCISYVLYGGLMVGLCHIIVYGST